MIIRVGIATPNMSREDSEIYIGKQPDGTIMTVLEYAARDAGLNPPPKVSCPNCAADGEHQLLTYDSAERRFIHQDVIRDCYRDDRTHDRDHPLVQQTVYKRLHDDVRYEQADIEYPLTHSQNEHKLWYDVGAKFPYDDSLSGIVVEVQHQAGRFSTRLLSRVRIAHQQNHGVYVIFTPSASMRQSYKRRLTKLKGSRAQVGSYHMNSINLGTMIRPGDDLSILRPGESTFRTAGHV